MPRVCNHSAKEEMFNVSAGCPGSTEQRCRNEWMNLVLKDDRQCSGAQIRGEKEELGIYRWHGRRAWHCPGSGSIVRGSEVQTLGTDCLGSTLGH